MGAEPPNSPSASERLRPGTHKPCSLWRLLVHLEHSWFYPGHVSLGGASWTGWAFHDTKNRSNPSHNWFHLLVFRPLWVLDGKLKLQPWQQRTNALAGHNASLRIIKSKHGVNPKSASPLVVFLSRIFKTLNPIFGIYGFPPWFQGERQLQQCFGASACLTSYLGQERKRREQNAALHAMA